jgi:3-oxoacyl-[acyl-carrier-protein] synthase-3
MQMAMPDREGPSTQQRGTAIYAHVVGWGMAVPDNILTNEDLAAIVETSDEWIVSRTGIRQRRIAGDKDSSATLGLKAAQRALEVADILPTEIDMVVVATSTPESVFPSTASLIQAWLGATNAGAFDLSAACSGFVYGIFLASQAIRSGGIQTAVVIGSETMSRVLDWQDRGTCILFGDGAGAVVLQASPVEGGVLSSVLRSDGHGGDVLGLPAISATESTSNGHKINKMFMNGGETFKFATRVISESVPQAVERAGITMQDVKLIVPHQANQRIMAAGARALKVDESIFMSNIERYGNTSAASIPIALTEAVEQGRVKPNDYIVLVGFGGGLAWGAVVIKWGVPQQEERPYTFMNRPRRQLSYLWAAWVNRFTRLSRRVDDVMSRARPKRGRMARLRRKIERHPLE